MATISWISLHGGDWADAINWQDGVIPGPLDDAVLNNSVAGTITVSDFQRVRSVSFHDPAAAYVVTFFGTLSAMGSVELDGAAVTLAGSISASQVSITASSVKTPRDIGTFSTITTSGTTTLANGVIATVTLTSPEAVALAPGATYEALLPRQTLFSGGSGSHVKLSSHAALFFGNALTDDTITDGGTGSTIIGGGGLTKVDVTDGGPLIFGGPGPLVFSGTFREINGDSYQTDIAVNNYHSLISYRTYSLIVQLYSADFPERPIPTKPTVVGGQGPATVFANGGGGQFWGGSGSMLFVGGQGISTVTGGSGSSTIFGGHGPDLLVSGMGPSTVVGNGIGTVLVASNGPSHVLVASAANTTLVGTANTHGTLMFANSNYNVMFGGSRHDTFVAAAGYSQIITGSGQADFVFSNGAGGGKTEIWNFVHDQDHVALFGYGVNAVRDAVANATVAFGSTTVTLADNTRITFANVARLTAQDFL